MKVGIISDSHDNIWNLKRVLDALRPIGVEAIIHCGDFSAPFVLKELDEFGCPVHGVFGNVDSDRFEMAKLAFTQLKNVTIHGDIAELNFDGLRICVYHNPKIAEALAHTGNYDVVFCGHTHVHEERAIGNCKLINPGEVMGRKGAPTFAVLDTESKSIDIKRL